MGKVVVIGIDGMDYDFVKAHIAELPHLAKLSNDGSGARLWSVFPADSIPSWITIYTGMGPEEHGIIKSIDYLNKNYKELSIGTHSFRGKTFWDIAGSMGRKVCIVNPFMAYPVWPVNGTIVSGPAFTKGDAQCYPDDISKKYGLPNVLGGISDFPSKRTLDEFVEKCRSETEILAEYSLRILEGEDWDLFFVTFLTLDRLQHFLWRYTDESDPTFPGANKHQDVVMSFYKIFDKIIGSFLSSVSENDCLTVISDHGHGIRCVKYLNLNEYLRQKGYLKSGTGKVACLSKNYWIEKVKHAFLQTLFVLDMEDVTYMISRFIPNRQKLKTSDFIIDRNESLARLSDFAGSGPYGGIDVICSAKTTISYEGLRDQIVADLQELNSKYEGSLFKWVMKREEKFSYSSEIRAYPDILFELHKPYGVNWGVFLPLISRNPFHKKISGGHKSAGVIFSNDANLKDHDYRVHDVKTIILNELGIC